MRSSAYFLLDDDEASSDLDEQNSYADSVYIYGFIRLSAQPFGGPGVARTRGIPLNRRSLYQLSYRAINGSGRRI